MAYVKLGSFPDITDADLVNAVRQGQAVVAKVVGQPQGEQAPPPPPPPAGSTSASATPAWLLPVGVLAVGGAIALAMKKKKK